MNRLKKIIYNQCKSKNAYYTTREANRAIERCKNRNGQQLQYYQCPHCKKYHLTSQCKWHDKPYQEKDKTQYARKTNH